MFFKNNFFYLIFLTSIKLIHISDVSLSVLL